MKTETVDALDPRSDLPPVALTPLAHRPHTLDGLTVVLLDSMAGGGSGMAAAIDECERVLNERAGATVVRRDVRRGDIFADDPDHRAELERTSDLVIYFGPPMGSLTFSGIQFLRELERAGIPTVLVSYSDFVPLVDRARELLGFSARSLPAPNPMTLDHAPEIASQAVALAITQVTADESRTGTSAGIERFGVAFSGNEDDVDAEYRARGWGDGLPLVPPTPDRVDRMLTGTSLDPLAEVTPTLRPDGVPVTVRTVAVNAVMAGAGPEHLPSLLAAVSLFGDPRFESMTKSVNSFVFAQLFNGPERHRLGMNSGLNALGSGSRSEAVLGRALSLVLQNAGGAIVGVTSFPGQGSVAAGHFVVAEAEEASPWPSFAADRGFAADESTVSLFCGGFSHVGNYHLDGIDRLAAALARLEPPMGALVLLSPKRANMLDDEGLSKDDVAQRIREHAVIPAGDFRASGFYPSMIEPRLGEADAWPLTVATAEPDEHIQVFPPDTVKVAVVGGSVAAVMQGWAFSYHSTIRIDPWR